MTRPHTPADTPAPRKRMSPDHEKKVVRLLRLYDRLMSGRRVYLPEVAEEFQVDLRSLQRDMADMIAMHLPIVFDNSSGRREYLLLDESRRFPVTFGISDAVVVKMALQMMQQYEGTGLVGYIQALAKRVGDRLNQTLAERARNLDQKLYSHQPFRRNYRRHSDQFEEILAALLYQDKLKIRYHAIGGKPQWRTVCPYTLMSYKTGLYLIARIDSAAENAKPTTFALERILSAQRQKEKFEPPEDWSPKNHFSGFGGLLPGKEEDVEIQFDPSLEAYLKHLLWPPKTRFRQTNKSTLVFHSRLNVSDEFVTWIVGFGPLAKVVKPASLVARVREHLSAALARYPQE